MIKFQPQFKNDKPYTQFMKFTQKKYNPRVEFTIKCPTCNTQDITKNESRWVARCSMCNHIHNFLNPFPVQALVRQLSNRIIALFGGTGSSKTVGNASIIADLLRNEVGVNIYALAQTEDQLKRTGQDELDPFFLNDEWAKHNDKLWKHKNGSKVIWYTSSDEQKLRGVNAGYIWLIEASGIDPSIYAQSHKRARQDKMKDFALDENGNPKTIYDEVEEKYKLVINRDKAQILLETNPHFGWVRDKVLLQAHTIIYTDSVRGMDGIKALAKPVLDPEDPSKVLDLVAIQSSTMDNPTMSNEYLSTIRSAYDTVEEYERDLYCNMSYTKGLVFGKDFDKMQLEDSKIHDYTVDGINTFWVEGIDPGGAKEGNDETAYILATYEARGNQKAPIITPRAIIKQSGITVDETAAKIWEVRNKNGWEPRFSKFFVADPSSKRENWSLNSYKKDLNKFDIRVNTNVNNDIIYGLKRMVKFIRQDALKIPPGLEDLWDEIKNYRWDTKKISKSFSTKKQEIKPVDRNNHLLDVLRYIIVFVKLGHMFEASLSEINKDLDNSSEVNWLKGELRSDNKYGIGDEDPSGVEKHGNVYISK